MPLHPVEAHGEVGIHLQPVESPMSGWVDLPKRGCNPVRRLSWVRSLAGALWLHGERSLCWNMFADRTCGPVRNLLLEQFLKDCILCKVPMLEQFVKNCSLWEGLLLEKFVKESFF